MFATVLGVALGLGAAPSASIQSVSSGVANALASRLVFVAEDDPGCSVRMFDVRNARTVDLVAPASCPERIITLHDRAAILLITANTLQEISVAGKPVVKSPLPLPVLRGEQPHSRGKPIGAGYRRDGRLSVVLASVAPTDDSEVYLYVYERGRWVLKEEKRCGRFALCEFASMERRPDRAYLWGEELRIWHDKQKGNPYITGRTSETEAWGEYTATTTALTFDFAGKQSVLSYLTIPGPDTGMPLTMGVSLTVQGKHTVKLADEQCDTSLMGKYLVLYRFWGAGTELIDLESGRSVLGRLKIAEWMY